MKTRIKNGRVVTAVLNKDIPMRKENGDWFMKRLFMILIVLLSSFLVFGQTKKTKNSQKKKVSTTQAKTKEEPKDTKPMLSEEEYAVFTAVLGKDKENFVVQYRTDATDYTHYGEYSFIKRKMPDIKNETFDDFNSKNMDFSFIEKKFKTKKRYFVLTKEYYETIKTVGAKFWDAFFEKYPKSDGFYVFSKVGFNKDGSQALLLVTFSCGSSCSEGTYYLLKKENNEWIVVTSQLTFKSLS